MPGGGFFMRVEFSLYAGVYCPIRGLSGEQMRMARYRGDNSDNTFRGTDAADVIFGRAGYDVLYGLGGNDRIDGGIDDDELFGGDGDDIISGGKGADYLYGESGDDVLSGDSGADVIVGGSGNDTLTGGAGDDFMRGGAGVDHFDGGAGFDSVALSDATATQGVVADLATGVVTNDGFGNSEMLVSVEGLYGSYFADTFSGTDADNFFGVSVGDTVLGAGGDDTFLVASVEGTSFDGGEGKDTLELALGSRTYFASDGSLVTDSAEHGAKVDLQRSTITDSYDASARITGFENVDGTYFDDRILGTSHANVLFGDGGNDLIRGGPGADLINGGFNNDTLYGGSDSDVFNWGGFFEYFSILDWAEEDTVCDFTDGDELDIRPFGTPLTFIGTAEFGDNVRAIRYEIDGNDTIVYARDHFFARIDLTIRLIGVHGVSADDFINLRDSSQPLVAPDFHQSTDIFAATHLGALGDLPIA